MRTPPADLLPAFCSAEAFAGCSGADVVALFERAGFRTVPRGAALYRAGDASELMGVVVTGKLKLLQPGIDGRPVLLEVVTAGHHVGEDGAITGDPRAVTATAITDAEVICVPAPDLRAWLLEHPQTRQQLLAGLTDRTRRATQQLNDVALRDADARIARQLLRLAQQFGSPMGAGTLIHHDLTQDELGQMAGAARETVSKCLNHFRDRGWIDVGKRYVTVLDMPRLRQRAR